MDCRNTQFLFSNAEHGRLSADAMAERQRHLDSCVQCQQTQHFDRDLMRTLERRLPQYPASLALKRSLTARWLSANEPAKARWPWRKSFMPVAGAVGILLASAVGFHVGKRGERDEAAAGKSIVAMEAVNSHLRLLDGETPLQVQAGDLHQVKPWFAGKLDFAPPVLFKGDAEYPLLGGEVSRFLEQRVAHFAFARRLHKISLFVLPARGLSLVSGRRLALAASPASIGSSRGFSIIGWQSGEFAYLLVSDVHPIDLLDLARRIEVAQ
jgi:anti-sigma factor RsiW